MSGYIGTQPVPQATQTRDSFTCTAGQTSFATSGYTPNFLDVYLNGVKLTATDYTASNGSDVVLASGAATGDVLEVVAFTTFDVVTDTITAAGTALTLDRTGSDGTILDLKKDGSTVGSIGASSTFYLASNTVAGAGGIRFGNDASTTLILPSTNAGASKDGDVTLGYSTSRFKDLYLSGGVYLGGTGSANKLDDYEEGTWTPTFSSGTATTIGQATYTKIGRSVTLCVENLKPSDTTSGNTVQIQSLPFAPATGAGGSVGSIMAQYRDDDVGISCYIPNNVSEIRVYETSVTGAFSALSHGLMFNAPAGAIYLTITYFTT